MNEETRVFDSKPVCPKCGFHNFSWSYTPEFKEAHFLEEEHLELVCLRCDHIFRMDVKND
jgi:5-methylcytosine-specific restriction endonuclease McrA